MDTASSPTAFILDFDGTITQKDTISTIANFAIACQKARGRDFADPWKELSDTYIEDYSRFLHGYKPAEQDRKTLAEEVTYYRNLKSLELASFTRVSKSGIFKDISDTQWRKGGRDAIQKGDVNVRKGFEDFVKRVGNSRAIWGVVSVNFSSQFIRGVLEASLGAGAEDVEVLANHPNEDGILLGLNSGPVMATSDAKLAAMNELLQKWRSGFKTSFSKVVYIGDSGTDIECLTAKGVVGIAMSTDRKSTLMDTLKRLGSELVHVGSQQEGKRSSAYWARDFEEVVRGPVFGLEAGNEI
ncbi:hypothetical protein DL98DRAFT_508970 [Cadophora sp. DSE1049]|nr:hypothetical protein DL98DRAFT_508970 [Cadophora sp. DSE1049]